MGKFVLLSIILFLTACSESNQNRPEEQAAITAEPAIVSNWEYGTSVDEMRGTKSQHATTLSTNSMDFEFPYNGGSHLGLTLRKNNEGQDIIVAIDKGQFICGIQSCEAAFKFDDGPVQQITMVGTDDHKSDVLFVAYDKTEEKIIQQIKKSKKLIIELPFYQEGKRQFIFNIENLEWE
ncbi:MAG TPA: hypothetical protein K8V79_12855 [Acinetobacter lwoffii]|uniref:Lipoprotein n=1 Tax=Acinetobacter lwoffii TaxID=28090 RepID=A0A9D2UUZ3_ACILW|nr:hypothetical protein [Acinetobacter lwoffii]